MSEFNRKHPELAAKLMTYIESGLNPDEIIAKFKSDDESKELDSEKEIFPGEIKLISQALAYRKANNTDLNELFDLFLAAYHDEIDGAESFRKGNAISISVLKDLLGDPSYKWLIVEAPSGREIERDGVILGACCYSTGGVSRRNGNIFLFFSFVFNLLLSQLLSGVIEGALGSIRLFGVLPRYRGLCIGRRLLQKLEDVVFAAGCCRLMVCVPSPRITMLAWIERRHYIRLGSCRYPADSVGHELKFPTSVDLVQFVKTKPSLLSENSIADDKTVKVFALVAPPNEHSLACTTSVSKEAQTFTDMTVQVSDIGSMTRTDSTCASGDADRPNMTLPPLWRNINRPSTENVNNSHGPVSQMENLSMNSDSKQPISVGSKPQTTDGVRVLADSGYLDSAIPGVD
jgi:GNAT superfamily N-acetyltransferase